jgi:uncharacterized delta-60 repeat protein
MRTHSRTKRLCFSLVAALVTSVAWPQQPFGLDPTFRLNADTWDISSVAVMDDGKILLSGRIRLPGDPVWWGHRRLVKVLANGQPDPSFPVDMPGGQRLTPWNDKFYVKADQPIRRLTSEGLIDPTFVTSAQDPLHSIFQGGDYHVFPDGRVLITGWHMLYDTLRGFTGWHCLVWLTNEGYLDTTRIHRTCAPLYILSTIHQQPDGKFLIHGTGPIYDGQPVEHTFRIHPNGDLDTTFQPGTPWDKFNAFTTLSDGRIIGTGLVKTEFNSPDSIHIVRLLPDGAIDPTFNYLLHLRSDQFGQFLSLWHTVLPDGRIVLHGNFSEVEGHPRGGIALLDADGHLLHTHFTGGGCGAYNYQGYINQGTQGMVQAPDGSWYIFGSYHGYDDGTVNDPTQRMVSRLYGLHVGVAEHATPRMNVYPVPATDHVTVELDPLHGGTAPYGVLVLRDALGRTVAAQRATGARNTVPLHGLGGGIYVLEWLVDGERRAVRRVVVE